MSSCFCLNAAKPWDIQKGLWTSGSSVLSPCVPISYSLSAPQFHCACVPCPSLPILKVAGVIHSGPDLPPLFVWQCQYLCWLWPVSSCRQKQILKQLSPGINWRYAGTCNFERTPVKMINESLLHMEKNYSYLATKAKFAQKQKVSARGTKHLILA